MERVKRLEIITNSLEMSQVIKILDNIGVSGYTIIKDVTGKGDRGKIIDDLETPALTNGYVLSVCTEEQESEVVTAITPILKKFGGVCIVSDAKWIAH
ncbi:transcriptional regulator [Calothrix sp. FACHB-1219]|uniref:P-II family nitrogen regulator n=1 Tax=unclassified Calothrix TaxID=2619626 RepID=UPI001687E54F|nr:transcriptional regulator [Calothrix sp. FACHB-168]MBD2203356.1 transcriptional regulator [Calothrix sp. FACHB-168]MBD2216347.1 transcriptional regulator [Calothrix sp. FACHB-1219]